MTLAVARATSSPELTRARASVSEHWLEMVVVSGHDVGEDAAPWA
jgi:hypothetical protein